MREITIIGGGLTGLALGRLLRRAAVPVTVLEAGDYPRHRVCGEFINGLSAEEFQELGLSEITAGHPQHRKSAWYAGGRCAARRELPEAATGISRWKLDAALAEDFRAQGGTLLCGERADVEPTAQEGRVMACGRRRSEARWLGLKAHYTGLALSAGLEMHLGRGGYAGLTEVEDGRVNVCALLPAGAAPRTAAGGALPASLRAIGLGALAERLETARVDKASVTGISHFVQGWQRRESGESLSLGDRAAIIPPFTGNGMSMALQSALCAAPFLTRWAAGDLPWAAAVAAARKAMLHRFARRMSLAPRVQGLMLSRALGWLPPLLLRSGLLPFRTLFRQLR
jgi:menaquinone-9 beta-reductase